MPVPEAQGAYGEIRALPGRAPMAAHRPHAPDGWTISFAGARAWSRARAQRGKSARSVRRGGRGSEVKVEADAPARCRKPPETATPSTLDKRASPRLYALGWHDKDFDGFWLASAEGGGLHCDRGGRQHPGRGAGSRPLGRTGTSGGETALLPPARSERIGNPAKMTGKETGAVAALERLIEGWQGPS